MKALTMALVLVAFGMVGCEGDCDCGEWCYDTYHVEGWCVWHDYDDGYECVCDIPCCWECSASDAACNDICSDDPFCIDY